MKRNFWNYSAFFISMVLLQSGLHAEDEVLIRSGSLGTDRTGGNQLQRRLAPDESLQGVEGQLKGLYAQRDAIVKGLHDLGYEICMKSRIGTADGIISQLSGYKKGKKIIPNDAMEWDCPSNAKCVPPDVLDKDGRLIVLPLVNQPHIYRTEFKKTQVIERLLTFEDRRDDGIKERQIYREEGKKIGFHRHFFQRNSCLAGAAIHRGCQLLSGEGNFKDSTMKRLKAVMDKNPEFKLRFDKDLACKIAESKQLYIDKLRPVQEAIVEAENQLKKARKGKDDDGNLICENVGLGQEKCTIREPDRPQTQPDPVDQTP